MASIFWPISSVALAVSLASSLTSLATTAKPLPASPARAASMVAFSASRLVCCAMEVMTLMTLPISTLDSPSLAMVALVDSATPTAALATFADSLALLEISRMEACICSLPRGHHRHVLGDLLRWPRKPRWPAWRSPRHWRPSDCLPPSVPRPRMPARKPGWRLPSEDRPRCRAFC